MSHYFSNDETLESKPRKFNFVINNVNFSFDSDAGVFSKNELDRGSKILIETLLPLSLGSKLLDLGCGIGPIGLTLAYFTPRLNVTCSDVNTRALSLCERNAHSLNLSQRVTILQSDIYENIEGPYDSIVVNPPIRAGKKVTYAMYEGAFQRLIDGGSLFIVIRKNQGGPSASKYIEDLFGNINLLKKDKGYYIYQAKKANK